MTIDEEPPEPFEVPDAVSAAGIAARLRDLKTTRRFDLAAVAWMVFVLAIVGSDIYSSLRFSLAGLGGPGSSPTGLASAGWQRLALLSNSGGLFLAVGCLVGVALAAVFESTTGRVASWLAAIGGGWVIAAGLMQVAVALHARAGILFTSLYGNKASSIVVGLADAGLGFVVIAVAWRFGSLAPEPAPVPTEPEVAEVS